MILAAVKALAEAAGVLNQAAADEGEVADIVGAQKGFRAEVRLVMGIHMMPAVLCEAVFVGVDHIRMIP